MATVRAHKSHEDAYLENKVAGHLKGVYEEKYLNQDKVIESFVNKLKEFFGQVKDKDQEYLLQNIPHGVVEEGNDKMPNSSDVREVLLKTEIFKDGSIVVQASDTTHHEIMPLKEKKVNITYTERKFSILSLKSFGQRHIGLDLFLGRTISYNRKDGKCVDKDSNIHFY